MPSYDFESLFEEYLDTDWNSPRTRARRQRWLEVRDDARTRWARVLALRSRNASYTEAVLDGLLPYADTHENRVRGRWVHPSSTLSIDVRRWFEREGWTLPVDWPIAAYAVVQFVERCLLSPEKLQEICDRFVLHPEARGFQASMLSPMLNALVPERYRVVSARSLCALRAFTGVPWSPRIETYAKANDALGHFLDQHHMVFERATVTGHRLCDAFELFAQWFVPRMADAPDEAWDRLQLVTGEVPDIPCWKFSLGEHAQRWYRCLADQSVALGWPELGDLTTLDREAFEARLATLAEHHAHYREHGVEHLWRIARCPVGSVLLAARGTTAVMGVGRVIEPYRFIASEAFPHRLGVEWIDTMERAVNQPEWERSLVGIDLRWVEEALDVSFSGVHARIEDAEPEHTTETIIEALPLAASGGEVAMARTSTFTAPTVRVERTPSPEPSIPMPRKRAISAAPPPLPSRATSGSLEALPRKSPVPSPPDRTSDPHKETYAHYSVAQCAEDTGYPEDDIVRWIDALRRKGQGIVLGGAGVGKTWLVRHLARVLASGDGIIEHLQFHPAYRYEDFVERRGPHGECVPGRLLDFVSRAQDRASVSVMLVDDVQRADLARVLGEALHALEYRAQPVRLASGTDFIIPRGIILLTTMSTSERSATPLDASLRRRFAVLPLRPRYDALTRYLTVRGLNATGLVEVIEAANRALSTVDHAIGAASFYRDDIAETLDDVWNHEVFPHLEQHLGSDTVAAFRWENIKSIAQLTPTA